MEWNFLFFLNSLLLGVGLAIDAFSASVVNGLNDPEMKKGKMCGIAGVFAFFQALMPMIGWICVHTIVTYFSAFEKCIPYLALTLLAIIGGKMIYDGAKNKEVENKKTAITFGAIIVQGIATSIDALSVGFTIADYDVWMALVCAAIIAVVTFSMSILGVVIGKKFGTKINNKAEIIGGIILILIGLEIFITGII